MVKAIGSLFLDAVKNGSPRVVGFIAVSSAICFLSPRAVLDWLGVGDFIFNNRLYFGFAFIVSFSICVVCAVIYIYSVSAKNAPRRNAAKEFKNLSKEERDLLSRMLYFDESVFIHIGKPITFRGINVSEESLLKLANSGFLTKGYVDLGFGRISTSFTCTDKARLIPKDIRTFP